jgi:hypothetical protein
MHNSKVAGVQVLWNPCKKQFSCSQSPLRRPAISPTLMPAWCVYKGEKNRTHCFSSVIKKNINVKKANSQHQSNINLKKRLISSSEYKQYMRHFLF